MSDEVSFALYYICTFSGCFYHKWITKETSVSNRLPNDSHLPVFLWACLGRIKTCHTAKSDHFSLVMPTAWSEGMFLISFKTLRHLTASSRQLLLWRLLNWRSSHHDKEFRSWKYSWLMDWVEVGCFVARWRRFDFYQVCCNPWAAERILNWSGPSAPQSLHPTHTHNVTTLSLPDFEPTLGFTYTIIYIAAITNILIWKGQRKRMV